MRNNLIELFKELTPKETAFYLWELKRLKTVEDILWIIQSDHDKGPIYTLLTSFNFRETIHGFDYWNEIVKRIREKYNNNEK